MCDASDRTPSSLRAGPDLATLIRLSADDTLTQVSVRSRDLADELKKVIRLAGRDPEALEGEVPALSRLYRVRSAGALDEPARVHVVLHRLIPDYLQRLPTGRDCRAIRELLTWEDEDGEWRSLTTRYYGARQISRCNTALTVCLGVAGIMAV